MDRLLADFRVWLTEHPQEAAAALTEGPPAVPVDLATIVGQFTALRHEVNLQTRAVRVQQEQSTQLLETLRQALETIRKNDEQRQLDVENRRQSEVDREAERRDEGLRPLLKTLVDVRDALALAQRQVGKMRDSLAESTPPPAPDLIVPKPSAPPAPPELIPTTRPSFWSRWFGQASPTVDNATLLAWARQLQEQAAAQTQAACEQRITDYVSRLADQQAVGFASFRQGIESILTGYSMGLQRLDRALAQQGLEPLDCLGLPFDPETMEVAEVVHEEGRSGTEVLEIVRAGYKWRDKLFRFALVRVARP